MEQKQRNKSGHWKICPFSILFYFSIFMKNHISNRWEIMILSNSTFLNALLSLLAVAAMGLLSLAGAHRGLLRWVNIGHFFSFSFSTKRGTNPLGAPLMRSAYSMRKFRPRWTSPSSLLFFWSNLLFSLSLQSPSQGASSGLETRNLVCLLIYFFFSLGKKKEMMDPV